MSIIALIEAPEDAAALAGWCSLLGRGSGEGVVLLQFGARAGDTSTTESSPEEAAAQQDTLTRAIGLAALGIRGGEGEAGGSDGAAPAVEQAGEESGGGVRIVHLAGPDPLQAVLAELDSRDAKLLVLAKHRKLSEAEAEHALERQLFSGAPCDVLLMRPGQSSGARCQRVLVPTSGGPHAQRAIELAQAAVPDDGRVDALYVQEDVGPDSLAVGQRVADRQVRHAVGKLGGAVRAICVVDDSFVKGFEREAARGYDLVLLGARGPWQMRRALFSMLPEKLLEEPDGVALGVLRRSLPLRTRFQRELREQMERFVPQLDRTERVELVDRIQASSRWEFDFIALVCLSTLIAALGLVQDSAAVVIGAMLVAPLMTPLVGGGLALVQGNVALIRHAIRAVGFGFLLAFGLGALLGATVAGDVPTGEMLARGSPNSIDLVIALVGGIAGAYASARPGLLGALPGVAIAAALVPPIATSGMAAAMGRPILSLGAGLLFLTNILAILLGAALSLWAVGIRAQHAHGRLKAWRGRLTIALVLIVLVLGLAVTGLFARSRADLPEGLEEALRVRVQECPGARLTRCEHLPIDGVLALEVRATGVLGDELRADLLELARDELGAGVRVRLALLEVEELGGDD